MKTRGQDLMTSFVKENLFIHDDWNPVLGRSDWDDFGTQPLLLGAGTCVLYSLAGFLAS